MRKKSDEENFEEAEAQAYRAWTTTTVPSETRELFSDPKVLSLLPTSAPFFHLVHAISKFVEEQPSHNLPLTSTLPDMKASTDLYIHLQKLYKARAEEEKVIFKSYLQVPVSEDMVDAFVKNSHALKLLKGKKWGALDADPQALGTFLYGFRLFLTCNNFICSECSRNYPETTGHASRSNGPLVLRNQAATQRPTDTHNGGADERGSVPTSAWHRITGGFRSISWRSVRIIPSSSPFSVRYISYLRANELTTRSVRAPTADLPNTAALLGGVVAQEVIKMITKQYIPINGSCIIDLIETWTGVL